MNCLSKLSISLCKTEGETKNFDEFLVLLKFCSVSKK